jgi:hypothetical protein
VVIAVTFYLVTPRARREQWPALPDSQLYQRAIESAGGVRVRALLQNKTVLLVGDSLMHFWTGILDAVVMACPVERKWCDEVVTPWLVKSCPCGEEGGAMDGGYRSYFVRINKAPPPGWGVGQGEGRVAAEVSQPDVTMVGFGAWAPESMAPEASNHTDLLEALGTYAQYLTSLTRARSVALWREYECTHFPTVSGEYHKKGEEEEPGILQARDGDCVASLTSAQVNSTEWWRRTVPNHVMRRAGVRVLRTFDSGVGFGAEHGPGFAHTLGDCRHFRLDSRVYELYLEDLADALEEKFDQG